MKNKLIMTIACISMSVFFTACGSNASLSSYQKDMMDFSDNISRIDNEMNAIDANSENAVDELLSCLDSMNEEFTKLADMEVPEHFASIETLADEAGEYMSEAVELYKQVFSTTPYDEYSSVLADESYKRAMKRVQYIGEILQGRIPEGSDVTVYEGDDAPAASEDGSEDTGDYEVPVEDLLEE